VNCSFTVRLAPLIRYKFNFTSYQHHARRLSANKVRNGQNTSVSNTTKIFIWDPLVIYG
jgi:hypothetical protein